VIAYPRLIDINYNSVGSVLYSVFVFLRKDVEQLLYDRICTNNRMSNIDSFDIIFNKQERDTIFKVMVKSNNSEEV
jgi:hypothetical protein